jgi:hypothetical protein
MVSLNIPAERIRGEAVKLEPAKVLLWLLTAPFLLLGLTARAVWWVLSLAIAAVKVGWEMGPARQAETQSDGLRR